MMDMNNSNLTTKQNRQTNRHISGISWRLFGLLAIFVSLILIVLWVFQILLLNVLYEDSKLDEFKMTSSSIVSSIDNEEKLMQTVYSYSVDTDTCIRVFEVNNGFAKEIASSDINIGCTIHHIQSDGLEQLYYEACEKGGKHTKKNISTADDRSSVSTIQTSVVNVDGTEYIIIFDSELVPLNTTVTTLERQFGWIACILVMGALILSLIMSRIICRPMEKMSKSAIKLARGDYSANFEGKGYREAHELAEALNFASSELAKTDNLQRELVANISHDLRTPLTMIKGYSEVMRDIPDENSPENVQVIIDETERLTELVNDMLDLSKIKSGTRKPELEVFDLTETVRAVMKRYEKLTERDNYRISFKSDIDVCVNADRTMILQVVYNLINNALNYTGEDKSVQIIQSVEGNKVRISVIDTGDGIAEEDIPYIWDRYYKVDKVHKRAKVGTGLGLSIVKGILEAHGAKYSVESEIGKGSVFSFELDIVAFCED